MVTVDWKLIICNNMATVDYFARSTAYHKFVVCYYTALCNFYEVCSRCGFWQQIKDVPIYWLIFLRCTTFRTNKYKTLKIEMISKCSYWFNILSSNFWYKVSIWIFTRSIIFSSNLLKKYSGFIMDEVSWLVDLPEFWAELAARFALGNPALSSAFLVSWDSMNFFMYGGALDPTRVWKFFMHLFFLRVLERMAAIRSMACFKCSGIDLSLLWWGLNRKYRL